MKKFSFCVLATLAGVVGLTPQASAQTVFGLTPGGLGLRTFQANTPSQLSSLINITGLNSGDTISAIDFRPSNELLYGYSSQNRLYTILPNGAASLVISLAGTSPGGGTLTVGSDVPSTFPPAGAISIDVNPNVPAGGAVGALRIVDTANGNLRFAFSSNTLFADDTLTFSGGGTPFIVGVAYTNPDTNPSSGTTLYYLDATTNSVYSTTAPNDGSISTGSQVALSIDIPTTDVGFDVQLFGTNLSYISANDNFYSLTVGALPGPETFIGQIGLDNTVDVIDIAVVPEPTTSLLLLGAVGGLLFRRKRNA